MSGNKTEHIRMNILPSLIILLIAGCGFFAGYAQNDLSGQAAEIYDMIYEEEETALLMSDYIRYVFESDVDQQKEMDRLFGDVYTLMLEWIQIIDSPEINGSMELLENITHSNQILSTLYSAKVKAWDMSLNFMYHHFEELHLDEAFELAFELIDGVEITISKALWNLFKDDLFEIISVDTLLIRLVDAPSPTRTHLIDIINDDTAISTFFLPNISTYHRMINRPLIMQRAKIYDLQREAEFLTAQVSGISMGTSVTTVAAVLSSAMSNRVNQMRLTHRILQVRADVRQDDSIISAQRDFLSLPVLILAAVLSIAGLVMAFLPI